MDIVTIHASGKERHAVADNFAGYAANLAEKQNYILACPAAVPAEEYGTGYADFIPDDFHGRGKLLSKLLAFRYYLRVRRRMKALGSRTLFLFSESEWAYLVLCMVLPLNRLKLHLYVHDPRSHSGEQWIVRLVHGVTLRRIGKRAETLFVSYQRAVEELKHDYPFLADRDIRVMPLPGMSTCEFPDLRDAAIGFDEQNEHDLIFFGRLEAYKGIDVLIEAMRILDGRGIRPKLLIVGGKGQMVEEVSKLASTLPHVTHVARFVENRELAEYISRSRVVVLPYKDATGTQTVQIANYYKRPTIVTATGAFPEYVEHERTGIVISAPDAVQLADAIVRLREDEVLIRAMKERLENVYEQRFNVARFSSLIDGIIRSE